MGVAANKKKQKKHKKQSSKVKNWSKLKLKTGPSMLRNIIGPVFNSKNVFFWLFCLLVFQNPLLSAGRMRFSKLKNIKMDQFLTFKRANIGPVFNLTGYIYVSIHTHHTPELLCSHL